MSNCTSDYCTISFGSDNCFHIPFSLQWGCSDNACIKVCGCFSIFGKSICLGFYGECRPIAAPELPKFFNFGEIGYILSNAIGIAKELFVENTMFYGQAAAMFGAIGYLEWDSGNQCFSSFSIEDIIYQKQITIFGGGVQEVGAPRFTPFISYTPFEPYTPIGAGPKLSSIPEEVADYVKEKISKAIFDVVPSLRDVVCNVAVKYHDINSNTDKTVSLCPALDELKVCNVLSHRSNFIRDLCEHPHFEGIMKRLTLSQLYSKIKLTDLFGSPNTPFKYKLNNALKVDLCHVFNKIFREGKVIEQNENVCDIVKPQGMVTVLDLLDFDICYLINFQNCGKMKLSDIVKQLDIRKLFYPNSNLSFGKLIDYLSDKIKTALNKVKDEKVIELDKSSKTLTILGIPITLMVKITAYYRVDVEGMGSPKRGFWTIGGAAGGGGYIGAIPVKHYVDLLKGQMTSPEGGPLRGPGEEDLPSGVPFAGFTMAWDILLAQLSRNEQTLAGAFSVVSRCDEWTEFLKSRLMVKGDLTDEEAKGIQEAFFNESYYGLAGVGKSHPLLGGSGAARLEILPKKYHESFDRVLPSALQGNGRVVSVSNPPYTTELTRVCVYGELLDGGKSAKLKICGGFENSTPDSSCNCNNKPIWFEKEFKCRDNNCSQMVNNAGGILGVELCGGVRSGPIFRPGILRIDDACLSIVVTPEVSFATDIFSFVLPLIGGPTITIGVKADISLPTGVEIKVASANVDIKFAGYDPRGTPKWEFGGPLYTIPDIPEVMAECAITGTIAVASDIIIDPAITIKAGIPLAQGEIDIQAYKKDILRVDAFDYLPKSFVEALSRVGVYRVGNCQPGKDNFGDCYLAGYYSCYEFCDHIDNDRDGIPDNNTGKTFAFLFDMAQECPMVSGLIKYLETEEYYIDNDGDGFGAEPAKYACTWMEDVPPNAVQVGGDCNDNDPKINPMAQEICDCKDNNCNGQIDEGYNGRTLYPDCDGDGFGDSNYAITVTNCCGLPQLPSGCRWVERGGDCDDNNCNISPIAIDNPGDGEDTNCDGQDGMVKVCFLRGDKLVCY
ncbi:MAG: putative metal-binding motif-containing protein, partial [Candidatus Calescibacterium sp.]